MTHKSSVYEEYGKYFDGQCPVSEQDFENTEPMKGDSTKRADVFIPEITTARLDIFIAQEEWAEEETEEETEED
ncbi:hypothetical protein L13192_00828 [Pyrenophora tritici-repentis]|nr:hypothetical protein L13192_00828 [Pyrenophora tritici-repentis]